jgi:hypothetical protein
VGFVISGAVLTGLGKQTVLEIRHKHVFADMRYTNGECGAHIQHSPALGHFTHRIRSPD